ncbi:GNAT family N-acetyltransferase [Pontibacillus sp. ALD_SL1]|uniref:GNAT family N-acetyltransferase n=1 Tax=Pontibacillus sp. ALD_SL1 TaxID=2777185 RepID=UPI001A973E82|nr:N-acetyltransferase [Pontibacillus sp. ALD_SL1]QSS98791.1 GNAT family N-acetyltransferase [Pontibacillus sp. ALD_SL1]
MGVLIQQPHDLKELAHFIAKLNQNPSTHIGYAGDETEEIYDTLTSDFSDLDPASSFSVCYEDGHLVGAMGVDVDLSDGTGEVWGPFIMEVTRYSLAEELWKDVMTKLQGHIRTYSFYIHTRNDFAQTFLKGKMAKKGEEHLVLHINRDNKQEGQTLSETYPYTSADLEAFKALHNSTFPKTYYNAEAIIGRLNKDRTLLFAKDSAGSIQGYVYIEASPNHGEASIEYVGVARESRRKGIGKMLIYAALDHIFSYEEIQEVSICVAKRNEAAIALYKGVGFIKDRELEHYLINK